MIVQPAVNMAGRVVVVTGAGNGLGRSHAIALAAAGAKVVVNDADPDAAIAVGEAVVASGGEAVVSVTRVGTAESAGAIIDCALSTWGQIDAVVNNAGILMDHSVPKMTVEEFETVVRVHLMGSFYVAQAAFRHMKSQGYGRLVHTTSGGGMFGGFGQANYAAAKAGIAGLSRTFAVEGGRFGITSNCVAPLARTGLTGDIFGPMNDAMVPEWVSPLVVFLASPQATMTGEVFSAGGGRFARIFTAFTPGWHASGPVTADDVATHLDEIMDDSTYTIPTSGADEVMQLIMQWSAAQ